MKKIICIFLSLLTVLCLTVPAFAEGEYVFDYVTDDLFEFAQIASTFGKSKVKAQSLSDEEYDVRRTVIVKTDGSVPNLKGFSPDVTVDAPDDVFVLSFPSAEKAEECAEALTGIQGIIYAECDAPVSISESEEEEAPTDTEEETTYHSWGMEYMHADVLAEEVREKQSEDDSVVVAVVDTGITPSHPIFEGRISECKDFTASASDYIDETGHGTNVAGIIADCTQGLNVDIMAIRVLSEKTGSAMIVAAGIEYAAKNGADIINVSLIVERCTIRFHDAQKVAEENGCLMVVSAGNSKINMDEDDCCPAHIKDVVTVTAIDKNGNIFAKNCYGSMVDVIAPGVDVMCASKTGGYMYNTGTSFAAPHVASIASMYKLLVPLASTDKLCGMITGNTIDVGESGFDVYCGYGLPWLSSFSADAIPKEISEISIKTLPDKTSYIYKEEFDSSGLSIEVLYDDRSTEFMNNAFTVNCPELKYGENTVTVTLGGKSAEFEVQVKYNWWQWIIVVLLFGWIWY